MKIDELKMDMLLLELGHDDFNRGTAYIREGIKLYEPGMALFKELYPTIAKRHNTTASRVERCMRHSLDKAWNRGNNAEQHRLFGWSIDPGKGRPTVGEYIARLARECRRED